MKTFQEAQPTRARKGKISGGRRSRHSKRRRATVYSFREPGPAAGLRLSYDPDDPLFPRRWVLSLNDVILQVTRTQPTELWNKLTAAHREQCRRVFEPVPIKAQEIRRIIEQDETRRLEFWDRVAQHGRKKHSNLLLGPSEAERKMLEIKSRGRTTRFPIKE